jgi:hypothetical protein
VRYTVWSRGRLIGDTDLGFIRLVDQARSGWFYPNADGERVMPTIAAVLPAMRAYLHRDAMDAQGDSFVHPAMHGSTTFADLAQAFQRLRSLDLELRREDGSVVPTSDIGIQDTEQLLELADLDDDDLDAASWDAVDDLLKRDEGDSQFDADIRHDLDLFAPGFEADYDDPSPDWMPDDTEDPQYPRYQIHVQLLHGDAIP